MTDRDYLRQAERERDAWKALAEARSDLLVAYRMHRPVTEAVLKRIDAAHELLREFEA